jgi:hypothetical protein
MISTTRARVARRAFGAITVLLLVIAGSGTANATGAARRISPIGRWDLTVTIHIEEPPLTAHLDCTLSADQRMHCVNMPDTDTLEGNGIWKQSGRNSFGFWITHHAHKDENGNPVGSIYAIHLGTFTRNRFHTDAFTYIDMHDGSAWAGPVPISGEAFRIG